MADFSKTDSSLDFATETDEFQRMKSPDLNTGYNRAQRTWELIVKYSGSLDALKALNVSVVYLLGNYAVLTVPEAVLDDVIAFPLIEYVEKPKQLFFADSAGLASSCIYTGSEENALTGNGVIIGIADSGIDYTHLDFRNADGSTRLLCLWDQTISPGGNAVLSDGTVIELLPPQGYDRGVLYTENIINEALSKENLTERQQLVPSVDFSGHGTAVAGIAAGNGRQGGLSYRGAAPESELIVVKLGNPSDNGFPRTTQLMEAVDFILKESIRRNRPVCINLSFGNNYGSHDGTSLVETYLNSAAGAGRSLIVVGTGNEAAAYGHASGQLTSGESKNVELTVGEYQTGISIQIWKSFSDVFKIEIIAPSGLRTGEITERNQIFRFTLNSTEVLIYYGRPGPYSMAQEIYIELLPINSYIDFGLWNIRLIGSAIKSGIYEMWLPVQAVRNRDTRFLRASSELTLTIPSTASKVLSVGAYNSFTDTPADFSGRGSVSACRMVGGCMIKPELVAPGVSIRTTAAGGGYETVTGTSFAAPFVTGAAALLMEWGIVRENQPYLYGEFLKAALIAGGNELPGYEAYPNAVTGYGKLCLKDSFT